MRFYRIKRKVLDNEVREITNDPDLLMVLRGNNYDFRATMEFLLITAFFITYVFRWAYSSEFDTVLVRKIIASQDLGINKNFCIYEMPEEKFLPSLWLLIGWLAFLLALTWLKNLLDCCNKGDSLQFLCVLSQGHKELVDSA